MNADNRILNILRVKLTEEIITQLLNYLKATDIEVGLLVNFGTKPGVKRKAFEHFQEIVFCVNLRLK